METLVRVIDNDIDMVAFGEQLGRVFAGYGGALSVHLLGNLGAGKTTLTRGILRAFGHQGAVKSPTYTLVEAYELPARTVYHFDLYRLGDAEELEYMGIRDYFIDRNLCLIEWPERGEGILPVPDLIVKITEQGTGRRLELHVANNELQQLLAQL
jgi:tRNA threonylcarbamoyladenosine biosynthesis protein TsaE